MPRQNARRNRRARVSRLNTQNNSVNRAAIAVARPPAVQSNNSVKQVGLDRVAHYDETSPWPSGRSFISFAVVPSLGERLGRLASLYQRIRYHSLRFEIRTQAPTTITGGYVAGFVRDPDDVAPSVDVLNYLTGQAGSKTANWWQSIVINVPATPDLFFTSGDMASGGSMRLYSPGKLLIAVDGGISSIPPMTVILHWNITLSEPSIERGVSRTTAGRVTLPSDQQFWDIANEKETTYKTALVVYKVGQPSANRIGDGGRYVLPKELGLPMNTIWETRPYSFVVEGPSDNFFGIVNTRYVVVVDSSDGYIRPAVKVGGRIVDASQNFGSFTFYGDSAAFAGQHTVFYAGDVWIEVDATGDPIDSSMLTMGEFRKMQADGKLFQPTTVVKKVSVEPRSLAPDAQQHPEHQHRHGKRESEPSPQPQVDDELMARKFAALKTHLGRLPSYQEGKDAGITATESPEAATTSGSTGKGVEERKSAPYP